MAKKHLMAPRAAWLPTRPSSVSAQGKRGAGEVRSLWYYTDVPRRSRPAEEAGREDPLSRAREKGAGGAPRRGFACEAEAWGGEAGISAPPTSIQARRKGNGGLKR